MIQNMLQNILENNEELIANYEETKWLVFSSLFIVPAALLNWYKGYYLLFFLLSITIFASMMFWQNATYSYRRLFDLFLSKIMFFYFLFLGILYLRNIGLYICYPNIALIAYCYNKSNTCYINNEKAWVNYHMLFHLLVGIQSFLITLWFPELYINDSNNIISENIMSSSIDKLEKTSELLQSIIDKVPKKHKKKLTKKKKRLVLVKDSAISNSDVLSPQKKPKTTKKKKLIVVDNIELKRESPIKISKSPKSKKSPKNKITKKKIKLIEESSVMEQIEAFKVHGIKVLESLDESTLNKMVLETKDAYYNSNTSLLSDNLYDILVEYIKEKYPENTIADSIGATITRNKVKLPYEMWSMDKIKPDTNALITWKAKYAGPYVVSCKLDGVSGLYDCTKKQPKLYTRGDGKVGQDISHLIPYLHLPNARGTVVRGEFILQKKVFDEKYKDNFANPRNMVSGLVNKQTYDENVQDLHFVVYELVVPVMKPSEQLETIYESGFEVVKYEMMDQSTLTNDNLSTLLVEWRQNYDYEIDGIIVADNKIHERKTGNPDHAFAFKMVLSDQMAEAKVVDVLWQASKDGYLKPRIRIEPIHLGGVKIEYATGFNGKFIEDNKIGIGALIQIIRSGDVIPHIKAVTMPADSPKMPEQPYVWSDKHVDVLLADVNSDPDVALKNISSFFVNLGIEGLAKGNIKRLIDAGYNSVPRIIKAQKADFEKAGFKTLAQKFVDSIKNKLEQASLMDIMNASNKLGRGISGKTIEIIMEHEPNILTLGNSEEENYEKLIKIKGIGEVNAKTFIKNIPSFLTFLHECGLDYKLTSKPKTDEAKESKEAKIVDSSHPLYNKKVVMTKVRDQEIIDKLKEIGGILQDNVNSETFVLIVKSKDDNSSKMTKAKEKGVKIMTPDEFKAEFF
jgi:NAD-dependent DNA ligase